MVGADGKVDDVKVVSGNPILTKSVVDTVKNRRFTPFKAQGQPAKAAARLSFDFRK